MEQLEFFLPRYVDADVRYPESGVLLLGSGVCVLV